MTTTNNICIIPVRGGSKRITNKNGIAFNGKPLVVHSIDYALSNSRLINKVVVSTDSEDLAKIATAAGAHVQMRPAELATDTATTAAVLQYVVSSLEENFDNVILLQATNPLRPKNLLQDALTAFNKHNADSLMTVSRNTDKLGKIVNNRFVPFNYSMGQRSQDMEPLYSENGLLYITKAKLIAQGVILGDSNIPFIVDHPYAGVDIDSLDDLNYAKYILETTKL